MTIWQENQEIKDDRGNIYTILSLLGNGGFAQTWLVTDNLGQKFALKKIKNGQNNTNIEQIIKKKQIVEWRELNKIKHKNIVAVKDLINIDNYWCILMEYVQGIDLGRYVDDKGPLKESVALKYIRQLSNAADYLHREKKSLAPRY